MSDVRTRILPATFQPDWYKNCAAWYNVGNGVSTTGWNSPSITWTGAIGVTTTANSITNTGAPSWGNSGVNTTNTISGNGSVSWIANDATSYMMFGLSSSSSWNDSYTGIQFALYMNAGTVAVWESGISKFSGSAYSAGDSFSVQVMGTTVTYYHNGSLVYTSATAASLPLQAGFAGFTPGGEVRNISLNNYVSAITDLSGTGNNLTASTGSTYQVATQSGANNQLGINFDGSGCLQNSTAIITGTDPPATYFLVSQTSITASYLFAYFNGDGGTGGMGYIINDGGTSIRSWYNSLSGPAWTATSLPNTFEITTFVNNGIGASSGNKQLYVNGSLVTLSQSTGADPTVTNDNFGLGGWSGNSLSWQGPICEFIGYSTNMSAAQIKEVTRYLGAKYGITVA